MEISYSELKTAFEKLAEDHKNIKNQLHELTQAFEKDIAIRQKTEKELIAAKEQVEESNRLKTHFMNNISHEIRTHLNGIIGFGNYMIDDSLSREE